MFRVDLIIYPEILTGKAVFFSAKQTNSKTEDVITLFAFV